MDARLMRLAHEQHRCFSRAQMLPLAYTDRQVEWQVRTGRLVELHEGVFAIAPVYAEDRKTRWMAATLTAPDTYLAFASAGAAHELRPFDASFETVVRPGSGGPRHFDGLRVARSETLEGNTTELYGIPLTTVERTIIDLAASLEPRASGKVVREALRLEKTTIPALVDALFHHKGRRGVRAIQLALARYSGLPVERCRSGSEVQALVVLREAGIPLPKVNVEVAGEEADLVWRSWKLIIEIDGGPFHLDRGEDARKTAAWHGAGYTVRRIPSDQVWNAPHRLLLLIERP